jgi:hypothetical protein
MKKSKFTAVDPQIIAAGYFSTIYYLQLRTVLFRFHYMNISLTANVLTMRNSIPGDYNASKNNLLFIANKLFRCHSNKKMCGLVPVLHLVVQERQGSL